MKHAPQNTCKLNLNMQQAGELPCGGHACSGSHVTFCKATTSLPVKNYILKINE